MRRHPRQSRARATVEAIEEAASLLMERGEECRFTTNHIAERAGVSIGSLYEYFTDKDDILHARGEAEAEQLSGGLRRLWSVDAHVTGAGLGTRELLAPALSPFRSRPAFGRAMLQRYAESPWALSLAHRQLERFLDLIGEENTTRVFGLTRDELVALIPRVGEAVAACGSCSDPAPTELNAVNE